MTSDGLTPLRGDDGRELYDLNEVRDFHLSRPGQGRWSERTSIETLRPTAIRVAVLRDADAGRLALDRESGRVLVDRLVEAPQVRRKVAGTVTELRSLGALDGPDPAGRLTLSDAGHTLLARFTRKDG